MAANPQTSLSGLARALVQQGKLKESQAESCAQEASARGMSFVQQLIGSGLLKSNEIASFASETFGYALVDLGAFDET